VATVKFLVKKTLSAQDKVILENELFAILGRVEGYLNNRTIKI
jgi:hypothetical protein